MGADKDDDDDVFEREYSILDLYTQGNRWASDYTENDAIDEYLEFHPEAKEADVRAELKRELARLKTEYDQHNRN